MHVGGRGEFLHGYPNAGDWTGKKYDISANCETF